MRAGWQISATAALAAGLLSACAVGPDFTKPAVPGAADYSARPLAATIAIPGIAGGEAQRFVAGRDVSADWWRLFHSKALDALIERALRDNPDLKAAQAALRVARENVLSQRGVYLPSVSGGFSAQRQKQSTILAPVPNYPTVSSEFQFDLFTPQVAVSYVPDVFGLNRRTVESAEAQEQQTRFQMIATYDTLVANVVVAAIQEAALRAQIDATRRLVRLNSDMAGILREQYSMGYASGLDSAAQESQLAQVEATLPPLRKALAQQDDLLAALTGRFPNQASVPRLDLASLRLPRDLPVSLPSALVAQRPDVRAARANLHAASAEIGIAIAHRLPSIELTANAGSTALAMSQVFTSGTGFWSLGGSVTAPIFQGGQLLHQERAAKAAYRQAAEQYRSTVLAAFQNVADTLAALAQDARGLQAAVKADDAAKLTLTLSQRQARDGYASDLSLLNAEQAYQQAAINLIQAQANRYADTAALYQALGGGWWNRADLRNDD
ncbi:MAG: efflux transporter outer membrane subunit [Gammaproteobacteria bacterium]|nr:efflux transporter outer membrane subunit [Gammaproteobacteria bacterium]